MVPVSNGITVGRVAGCDIVINDAKASRRHARFVVESGVVEIEDLGSSNGTLLNSKPVTRRLLRDGDQVQIGMTILTFREGAPPGVAGAAGAVTKGAVDNDNDLFGSDSATATDLQKPPAPPPSPARPPAAPSVPAAPAAAAAPPPQKPQPPPQPVPTRPASPPPAPLPPHPRPAVVEFADEVVEIRRAEAPAASKPGAVAAAPVVASPSRILQFQKQKGGGGLLGDDMSQLSGGTRSLIFAVVLVFAAAVVWGVMELVR
ncbi:MAG TPA: FHA domain-containing protein [Planctomycetota bacterium]|nr:FHA domain-containing protein [Planctomycetota bacterium]